MPDLPLVGTEFAGYRLRSVLGRGGMSIVYQAENPRLRNVIALKVLAPELADDQVFRTRFREESQIAASLNHPNVIPIHDFGSSDGLLYIAMLYVSGTDLRQMITEQGWLTPRTAVYLLGQAARALDAAHRRGLVHRDVKPGNLLVARNGSGDVIDPEHVYLADFGITKHVGGRSGLTSVGAILGTLHYMSPEQIQEVTVLGTADQYSLGCVFYECLTGRAPFEKTSNEALMWAHMYELPVPPSLLRPELPPAIDEVIDRVLAKHPDDRYTNCREFIAAARDALGLADPRGPDSHSPGAGIPGIGAGGIFQSAPVPSVGFHDPGLRDLGRGPVAEPLDPTAGIGWPAATADQAGARRPSSPDGAGHGAGNGPVHGGPPSRVPGRPSGRPSGRLRGRLPGRLRDGRGMRAALSVLCLAILAAGGITAGILAGRGSQSVGTNQAAESSSPVPGTLLAVLANTEAFTGLLPLSTCVQQAVTLVQCTNPSRAIASVTFKTYPSLAALYSGYQEIVANLSGGQPFSAVENLHPCSAVAPEPTGESSWNHSDSYSTKYSVAQLASGNVPTATAMGRVFCAQKSDGSAVMVWTQNSGRLLGYATGGDASHEQVWNWFYAIHHNIIFPGQPGMAGMRMSPTARPATAAAS